MIDACALTDGVQRELAAFGEIDLVGVAVRVRGKGIATRCRLAHQHAHGGVHVHGAVRGSDQHRADVLGLAIHIDGAEPDATGVGAFFRSLRPRHHRCRRSTTPAGRSAPAAESAGELRVRIARHGRHLHANVQPVTPGARQKVAMAGRGPSARPTGPFGSGRSPLAV